MIDATSDNGCLPMTKYLRIYFMIIGVILLTCIRSVAKKDVHEFKLAKPISFIVNRSLTADLF